MRSFGYAEREQDLLITHGLWSKRLTAIPYGRMLSVNVESGPIDRSWGLARVELVTASIQSAGHIPGLPQADAAVVALARAAGAWVLGKTACTVFANMTPCTTRNPHDAGHTPGGSSSGSCAAVAVGAVPLALGTQTGGSVIRPASYCGVVGYKPSFGWLPTAGLKCFSWSLDTAGVFA